MHRINTKKNPSDEYKIRGDQEEMDTKKKKTKKISRINELIQ